MTANRVNDRYSSIPDFLPKVLHLTNTRVDMFVLDTLRYSDRERLHVAPGHATVSVQAFIDDDQATGFLIEFGVVHRQKATDIYHRIFLG